MRDLAVSAQLDPVGQALDELATECQLNVYSGVPCSRLEALRGYAVKRGDLSYHPAASEGIAIAIAAGAWLAGRQAGCLMQNSGLGNALNPISSLLLPYQIPALLMCSYRGNPATEDEPQHRWMGDHTPRLLEMLSGRAATAIKCPSELMILAQQFQATMQQRRLLSVLCETKLSKSVSEDSDAGSLDASATALPRVEDTFPSSHQELNRRRAIEAVLKQMSVEDAVVGSTGYLGRELFDLHDTPNSLYLAGSMGLASAVAATIAKYSGRTVYCLDGDGAALMHMGALHSIATMNPRNFVHVVVNNGNYASTGGQPLGVSADFCAVARACGYAYAGLASSANELEDRLSEAAAANGPAMVEVHVPFEDAAVPPRPTIQPPKVAARFREFVASYAGLAPASPPGQHNKLQL